ncbi:hypothetical protein CKN73_05270 [Carnobacterium divergens]|nr:hypothetical protein CKN77_05395 [Carnobacterium divergens]TFJ50768.1 hypothetical protein CKN73_05270 [Carnobacterium divergens]TFJ55344.1 hypothetical protein CKN83_05200 [Carnobacterium divergens]TFJ62483.1 hypothetical protein CKN89_05290 [Carnobacterium divergens]TFJ72539.1 hypothetical protein CKN91_05205 [Carnobacterium divergens]
MKMIKILLADQEEEYILRFKNYIESQREKNRFELIVATTKESLIKLAETENFDLVLATPIFFDVPLLVEEPIVIGLDDETQKNEERFPLIFKYQSLSKVVNEVVAIYFEKIEKTGYYLTNSGDTKLISVFSSVGSTGKTTFTLNLAKELIKMKSKVLYLNMETIHSTEMYLKDDNKTRQSSELFYFAQKRSDKLLSKMAEFIKTDSYLGIDYFDFIQNPEEMIELSATDIHYLITVLKNSEQYDFIVVDIDSQLHERNLEILKNSQKIFWLIKNEAIQIFKTEQMATNSRELLDIEVETNPVISFLMSHCRHEGHYETNLLIRNTVPYVSSWQSLKNPVEIFENHEYNQSIANIIVTDLLSEEVETDD